MVLEFFRRSESPCKPTTSELQQAQESATQTQAEDDDTLLEEVAAWVAGFFDSQEPSDDSPTEDPSFLDGVRQGLAEALIAAIRAVSSERDREEVVLWFANARAILSRDEATTSQTAAELYQTIDTRRLAGILANTAKTSALNYTGSSLPLALKLALPVAAGGLAILGTQGAGIVAFGGGIGLPVALLLFLGTAGVTTVVEAFVKDRDIRDPLTKLVLAFAAADSTR